jgi:FKBP-type peptidyl-prolyl cis-trans isomerase 2
MSGINAGDKVRMHYNVSIEDGTMVDSSEGKDPLEFTAGSQELIPGVSNAVIGMQAGDKKTIEVPPEQGYGPHNPEAMQKAERKHFPPDVKIGDFFQAVAGENQMMVQVAEVHEDHVLLDANHPLAGRTLTFNIEIVE